MSRLWPEPITVFVTPAQLHVSCAAERWVEPCIDGPIRALEAALAKCQTPRGRWQPRASLRLLLSHHLAPLVLVPHVRQLQGDEERQAAARHQFAAIYGPASANWQFVVDDGAAGDAALAAGIDAALIEGLRHTSEQAGLRLRSIEPLISAAMASQPGDGWLAVAESGRVVLARRQNRAWQSLRMHRPRRSLGEDLVAWIEQARLIDGVEGPDEVRVVQTQAHDLSLLQRPDRSLTQTVLPEAA